MTKFKIKMKLTGLELEIEGSREDVPLITANLGNQLAGLLRPAAAIASGADTSLTPTPAALPMVDEVKKRKRRVTTARSVDGQSDTVSAPIDFRHDPVKFGTPKQSWKTSEKALWLLHVVEQELSGAVIVATFNKHFRQAGTITTSNANRDLGRLKSKSPAVVGEDTTQTPPRWFLTEEGTRQALKLVGDALGRSSA